MSSGLLINKEDVMAALQEKGIAADTFGREFAREAKLKADAKFLMDIASRMDLKKLLLFTSEQDRDDVMRDLYKVEQILGDIALEVFEVSAMKGLGESSLDALRLFDKISQILRGGFTEEMLLAFQYLAASEVRDAVHFKDICGGSGILLHILGIVRKGVGSTSGECIDINPEKRTEFYLLNELVGPAISRKMSFVQSDFRTADLSVNSSAKKYWMARYPDHLIDEIFGKLKRLHGSEIPEGVAVLPCHCHCYDVENYPLKGEKLTKGKVVSEEDWKRLSALAKLAERGNPAESKLIMESQRIMDCFRALCFEESVPEMECGVRAFLQRSNSHMIYAKKRD